jgi:folate-binding protein YgfZ
MTPTPPVSGRWFPLDDRAIFRLTGPDRIRYLNGQVTNDVAGPLDHEAIAACLCNIKGRVEALVHISADGDSLLLDGELAQREAIHARLERYLIADDCEIIDETERHRIIHHFIEGGPGVKSRRLNAEGRDLILRSDAPVPFDPALRLDDAEVALHELLALVPRAGHEITGEEFPAELRLDEIAVDFHKGCYLGQEIISRIESVGKVKRRLTLIETLSPVDQGLPVANFFEESGFTTRPTRSLGENCHLGLAIFRISLAGPEVHRNQEVTSFFKPAGNNS